MKRVLLGISFILCFIFSNCSEQPTSVSDPDGGPNGKESPFHPDENITDTLKNELSKGNNVYFPEGTFYVSETIIIQGYSGVIKGAGKDLTIIEVDSGFKATVDPLFPSSNKLTEIFAFYFLSGDITFQDMTILVKGDAPAEKHNNPFVGEVTTIDNAIVVDGTNVKDSVTVIFRNLKIIGEMSDDNYSFNNRNLIYPLIATGLDGSGSVGTIIENCEIENSGKSAIEYFGPKGGSGEIRDNKITNCFGGIRLGYANSESYVTIRNNIFQNITENAIDIESRNWTVCIKDNTLDGVPLADDCP